MNNMSEWEARRKRSLGYYACLLLFIWPVLIIPLQFIFAPLSLTAESLAASFMILLLVGGLAVGCGTKYGLRGINPGSRTVLSSIDDQYLQASATDVSDN